MAYTKLPYWVQEDIEIYERNCEVKIIGYLRRVVSNLQGDSTKQKLNELERRTKYLSEEFDKNRGHWTDQDKRGGKKPDDYRTRANTPN